MKSARKKIIEKIVNFSLNILLVIFGFILLISIYTGIQTKLLHKSYADFFGYSLFEVQTGSMADTINAGDWIVIRLTSDVKLNDIVTYKLNDEYITHRLIEAYNGTYVTKGDANNSKDEPIDQSQVIGKVVKILGNFGVLRKTIFSPSVLIAIIITLFLFNLAFKKNKKENDNKSIINKIKEFINKKSKDEFEFLGDEKSSIEIKTLNDSNEKYIVEEKKSEEELEKTSMYRVVSVDGNEVETKYKEVPKTEEEETQTEEELEKTAYFRVIPVDASEVNDTLMEIAENELKNNNKKQKNKVEEVVEEPELKEETLTDINLDFLKSKKGKKSKNIIETAILIKKEELNELINLLMEKQKNSIKEELIDTYVNIKYYSSNPEEGKPSATKVRRHIKEYTDKLIDEYKIKDKKTEEIIKRYNEAFELIICLDFAKDSISNLKVKNEFYKKAMDSIYINWSPDKKEEIIESIIKIQKTYTNTLQYFLEGLETSVFNLNFNKIASKKNMFALDLQHNISFSKVYSDYIIDKTYTEGVIAEDKITVLLTLLSSQLIKDLTNFNYDKKYILYIPESLYDKEKKLEKLLKMLDDKFAKSSVYILVTYQGLLSNKKIIKEVRQSGYKFALAFDKDVDIQTKDKGNIYIADYVFIDKKVNGKEKIFNLIPEELKKNTISEDIINKVGGSE